MSDGTERWLPVVDWEGLYEVSDLGRVRSLPRRGNSTPQSRKRTYGGQILKPVPINESGHLSVTLCRNRTSKQFLVHRLVLAAFTGPCPEGQEVRHLDGDPSDNTLEHLAYGTRQENMLDVLRYGTHHNTAKTRCKYGHEYTPENTRIGSRGDRNCRECARTRGREYERAITALPKDDERRQRSRASAAARARKYRARKRGEIPA
jgi:HNH endonuclease/NUMOD4 motif